MTDLGVGNYQVNFTNPMPSAFYVGFATFDGNYNLTSGMVSPTTTTVNIISRTGNGSSFDPGVMYVGFLDKEQQ